MQRRDLFRRAAPKCFLAFALLCVVAGFGQAQTPTPTPSPSARPASRPFPPPQYIPPHDYDQRNIKLTLHFDWDQEQAIGTAAITLAPTVKDLQRVDFDAAYMTVSAAALASGAPLKFEYDPTKEKLSVLLDRVYQPTEQLTVVISYHTKTTLRLQKLSQPSRNLSVWSLTAN